MTFCGKTFKPQCLIHCGSFPSMLRFPDFLILALAYLFIEFSKHMSAWALCALTFFSFCIWTCFLPCVYFAQFQFCWMVYPWQVTVLAGLIKISRKVDFLLDHNADLFEPCANREHQASRQWASTYWKARDSRHIGCILSPLGFFLLIYCCYHSGLCCCWKSIPC